MKSVFTVNRLIENQLLSLESNFFNIRSCTVIIFKLMIFAIYSLQDIRQGTVVSLPYSNQEQNLIKCIYEIPRNVRGAKNVYDYGIQVTVKACIPLV